MNISILLFVYGLFLITCGVLAVVFIGLKAKTALISGGLSGMLAMGAGHLMYLQMTWAPYAGFILTAALFSVFAWRSTLTLYSVFELASANNPDLRSKIKAFLIIALMAVVSMVVMLLQWVALLG
ncbi:MAG: hypothetical protein V4590_07865 [Bacteroidota bacterium]